MSTQKSVLKKNKKYYKMNIPTFCISLRKKEYKWREIIDSMKECGLDNSFIFEAVNGVSIKDKLNNIDVLSPWTYYKINNNIHRHYHAEIISWGAVGCYLSHYLLWKQLLEDPDNDRYLIFEDDFRPVKKHSDVLRHLINNVPDNADFAFFDVSWKHKPTRKYNDFYDVLDCQFFGTHCYIVTKQGVQKVIKHLFPIEVQIDAFISHFELNKYLARIPFYGNKQKEQSTTQTDTCIMCYPNLISGGFLQIYKTKILVTCIIILCFIIVAMMYHNKIILSNINKGI